MFIDWSGSMHYNLMETLKQTFSLALFCKQIGVPFELYAFKDSGSDCPFSYIGKTNVIRGQRVVLRNFLSSRMNTEEMNFAMSMLWCAGQHCYINSDGMGGTPLNDAIMIAPKVVEDFIIRNKVVSRMVLLVLKTPLNHVPSLRDTKPVTFMLIRSHTKRMIGILMNGLALVITQILCCVFLKIVSTAI
jgi:hypothetical protein